jgi:hypothetical protein
VDFKWRYLREPGKREEFLFGVLGPSLRPGDRVLDALCGYSLMSERILSEGFVLTGFDIHPEPIEWLTANRPSGKWICRPVESFYVTHELLGFDVIMLLGADEPVYTEEFQAFLGRLLSDNSPRTVLLEAAVGTGTLWFKGYCDSVATALSSDYMTVRHGQFDSEYPTDKIGRASGRERV